MPITKSADDTVRVPLALSPSDDAASHLMPMTRPLREPVLHPGVDLSRLWDLIDPARSLWTPSELQHLTGTVAAELTVPLLKLARFVPERRWWTRLALIGDVELWLLSWTPGQNTSPHDHGGACGSFTVLLGELTEDYRCDYRYHGGPSRSALREAGTAVGFGPNRAHRIRNLATRDAVSMHAYSPPLLPIREYTRLHLSRLM